MKIVDTSNFDKDDYTESVIAENVSEYWAEKICKLMNDYVGPNSSAYYVPKPDDYVPFVWEP